MVKTDTAFRLAISFPGVTDNPHFDKTAFKVNKKIFSTLDIPHKRIMVKLPLIEQSVFCKIDPQIIYPVPGSWGAQGATFIELGSVKSPILKHALRVAYEAAAVLTKNRKGKK